MPCDRDTVCSVGFIPRYLPFTSGNTGIRYFRHALALDEHRAKFMPNFTKHWDEEEDDSDVNVSGADLANMQGLPGASDPMHDIPMAIPKNSTPATPSHRHKPHRESTKEEQFEEMINKAKGRKTDSLEVWFAGAHTGQSPCLATTYGSQRSCRRRRWFGPKQHPA
jgi:uncharacterized protein (DUF2235 family)